MRRFVRGDAIRLVGLDGTYLVTREGDAAIVERELPDRASAEAALAVEIAAHLASGYVEVRPPRTPPDPRWAADDRAPHVRQLVHPDGERITHLVANGTRFRRVQLHVHGDDGDDVDDVEEQFSERATSTPETALGVLASTVDDLLAQGWTLRTAPEPLPALAPAPVARDAALEAQCRAAPDDPLPHAVYADWLVAHGDPVGEIALLRQHAKPALADRVLHRRRARLLGHPTPLGGALQNRTWRHGFLGGVTITGGSLYLTGAILELPVARLVDAVRLDGDGDGWTAAVHAIAASPHAPHLRELRCGITGASGDLSAVWRRLPRLEVLELSTPAKLGVLAFTRLHTFIRRWKAISRAELDAIHAASWPELAHLELWTGSRGADAAITSEDLARITDADSTPQLCHLGIVNSELAADAIAILATSRVLPRLRTLDLSHGNLRARGASALLARADAFAHLAAIDLSNNCLTPSALAELQARLPNIVSTSQRADEIAAVAFGHPHDDDDL